jgi:hypothetical protein
MPPSCTLLCDSRASEDLEFGRSRTSGATARGLGRAAFLGDIIAPTEDPNSSLLIKENYLAF